MMILKKLGLLFCLIATWGNAPTFLKQSTIKHTISVYHPGISQTERVEKTLIQVKGKNGQKDEFYLDVETVVYDDAHCKIDLIRLYWDALGFYDRLVIPSDVALEKAEGRHFSPEDYQKLDDILSNRNVSLKDLYKEEVTGTASSDGIIGATVPLNNNDYIKGAVWTCYTLWHLANGDVFTSIRDIVGQELSVDTLAEYIKKEDIQHQVFALEQMIKRENYSPEFLKLALNQALTSDYSVQELTIDYLKKAPDEVYFSAIEQLMNNGNQPLRILCLNDLLDTNHKAAAVFYERLNGLIYKANNYQEVSLLSDILERKKCSPL